MKAATTEGARLTLDSIEVYKGTFGPNERAVTPTAYAQLISLMYLNGYEHVAAEFAMLNRKVDTNREHFVFDLQNETMRKVFDELSTNLARRGFWRAAGV